MSQNVQVTKNTIDFSPKTETNISDTGAEAVTGQMEAGTLPFR